MYGFSFERANSVADAAVKIASGGQALAGGQTLLASMKQRLSSPEKLVDLSAITELKGVYREGNSLVIGAMTRHQEVANNAEVKKLIPALGVLAAGIGD